MTVLAHHPILTAILVATLVSMPFSSASAGLLAGVWWIAAIVTYVAMSEMRRSYDEDTQRRIHNQN